MTSYFSNPVLPCHEYVPDIEPHVFGDRVYLYGSHDAFGSTRYCPNDYVCYSASVADLSNWKMEGVIYRRRQDPDAGFSRTLWAPDVVCGPDGKYYLYYCLSWYPGISVAVCDTPAGEYTYLGKVRHADGVLYGKKAGDKPFDPGVLYTNGDVYLYSGYSPDRKQSDRIAFFNRIRFYDDGAQVMRLERDMLTIADGPRLVLPGAGNSAGTGFEGHEFYEAPSFRCFDGVYYAIWSSVKSHELCYATSNDPDRDFRFRGPLISNGDVGINGATEEKPHNYVGNNHGSLIEIQGKMYIFYHRQTNRTEQARQACAELVNIAEDGLIHQAEMTSQGLRGGPFTEKDVYPAYMACELMSKNGATKCSYGPGSRHKFAMHPCMTQDGRDGEECDQYIHDLQDGSIAGFKYFDVRDVRSISVATRGSEGEMSVYANNADHPLCVIQINPGKEWAAHAGVVTTSVPEGAYSLRFAYHGAGKIDFLSFSLG